MPTIEGVPPAAEALARVRAVVTELTGLSPAALDDQRPFAQLGMDSLTLTQLAAAATRALSIRVTLRQLMTEVTTIEALAALVPGTAGPSVREAPPRVALAGPIGTLGGNGAGSGGRLPADVRALFEQQLALMAAQLDTVAALTSAAPAAMPAAPVTAPVVSTKAVASTTTPARAPLAGHGPLVLTPHQQRHLDRLIHDYCAKTPTSKQLVDGWRPVHADPRTAAGFNPRWKEMTYPLVVDRSEGAMLWDVDGNAYVDLLNGFGPGFLGHRHPAIVAAIEGQLARGFEVGPLSPLAGEAAELVCRLTGMTRATFVCTGSEAVQAAIRAARTHTSRDTIVTFTRDYHGNFDEVLVRAAPGRDPARDPLRAVPSAPGIPQRATADMVVLDYGTPESLEIIRTLGDRVAGVLVEPVQSRRPEWQPREFLHALRALTQDIGAVLIFDEVVTGFRLHPGGAQAWYGVEADIATYGKVLGGGMPVGVVAGRRPFMDVFDGGPWQFGDASGPDADVTFFAGTFVRHPLVMAAVVATLRELEAAGPALQQRLNARTDALVASVQHEFDTLALPYRMTNCGSLAYLRGTSGHPFETLLFHALRLEGVHILDGFPSYLTIAHTDEVLASVTRAVRAAGERLLDGALVAAPEPGVAR